MDDARTIVVAGDALAPEATALLERAGCATVFADWRAGAAALAAHVGEVRPSGLLVRQGQVTREVLLASPRLRAISKHGVGVDKIDVAAATELGIPVMVTALANYESVAEHTLALMLALARQLPRCIDGVRAGRWEPAAFRPLELADLTLGLLGFGRVGRRVAELVAPLRMKVLVHDPFVAPASLPPGVAACPLLDDLLGAVDVLSIHCPLGETTRGLIDRRALDRMRPGSLLINTARGAIVDEAALADVLAAGRLSGAALDTLAEEPPDPAHPLLGRDDVIVTSHVAGLSVGALQRMGVHAARNLLSVLDGERPDPACLVNPTALARRTRAR